MNALIIFSQTNTNALPTLPDISTLPAVGSPVFWQAVISVVTPVIVWSIRTVAPKIPTMFLPAITPLIGIVIGGILNWLASAKLGWIDMATAGALAVFVREVVNQSFTKYVQPDTKSDAPK